VFLQVEDFIGIRDTSDASDDDEEEDESDESIHFEEEDVVFLAAKAEDILSSIEIWMYEEADDNREGNLLVHHDFPLANFPLCCEYIDVQPGNSGRSNLVAVGSMKSGIEIYDLDILDPVSPLATLEIQSKKKRPSTMALSANEHFRNVLASGGDDKRVRIWDLSKGQTTADMKAHKSSIQCVKWNPKEASILVSGGHDKKCFMMDARTPDGTVLKWKLKSDNECLAWCPHEPTCFLASDEEGNVNLFDARNGTKSDALFCLKAHKDQRMER